MFDITPDDISQLNDTDLRELVGRLCEAELAYSGLPVSAVTWGGSQTAPDGGLDVRVSLPTEASIDGFVPRPSTGFQVKRSDMPKAAIMNEMRPAGVIRPFIAELADTGGAYVIVSSASTSDSSLRRRQDALRGALNDVGNAVQLYTDFYDRTRLASWVRRHPGLITWVKEKVGRAVVGWQPYGPWSGKAEGADAEYFVDGTVRLHFSGQSDDRSVTDAIDQLRGELAQPGKTVRLVGLSGVGKTRLVQALFDARIGAHPLPTALAVYTNLSDDPDPQPIGLASDLLANRMRAVLIVDNCPTDLHRRLFEQCSGSESTLSVMTVEYDIRDDQPEGSQVVRLEPSSPDLIQRLLQRRYPHLSQVDAGTIAEAAGGNARIAIALAETVGHSETISGLSNDELFQRLFQQRHASDNALLLAAEACALVYSFNGEELEREDPELDRLGSLVGQTDLELYRHVGEMRRRDLVQSRGVWLAVLPHAIANRLAVRALDDIPYRLISRQILSDPTGRLARSFSRRLSFLHEHTRAVDIVDGWLAPEGLLGSVGDLDKDCRAMFKNVAPVSPEASLAALERVRDDSANIWAIYLNLLRSLAYESTLFLRSTTLISEVAIQSLDEGDRNRASEIFGSLFPIYLSGTHAPVELRLQVIEGLFVSGEEKRQALALSALNAVLKTALFSSSHDFGFGSRSRDFGFRPRLQNEISHWYLSAIAFVERLGRGHTQAISPLRVTLANNFRGLWGLVPLRDNLESAVLQLTGGRFWREIWVAVRQTIRYDRDQLKDDGLSRLNALERSLRPSSLPDQVRAFVLGKSFDDFDIEDTDVEGDSLDGFAQVSAHARGLGSLVASDDRLLEAILPDLLLGGARVWDFGIGVAVGSQDPRRIWDKLIDGLGTVTAEKRDVQLLAGFLFELWERDREMARQIMESAFAKDVLWRFLPRLYSAIELDDAGIERFKDALRRERIPVELFGSLSSGRAISGIEGHSLRDFLLWIAEQPRGINVALDLLFHRIHSDRTNGRRHEPEILEAGRRLLPSVVLDRNVSHMDHMLRVVVKKCLEGAGYGWVAADTVRRLKQAVNDHQVGLHQWHDFLAALLNVHPIAVLDELFAGEEDDYRLVVRIFEPLSEHRTNPADEIPCEVLEVWCEREPQRRYSIAAAIVTFSHCSEETGLPVWSAHARMILAKAPDANSMLLIFIRRFHPCGFVGSVAGAIEENARLLDDPDFIEKLGDSLDIDAAKRELAGEITRTRAWETARDRVRDERFE